MKITLDTFVIADTHFGQDSIARKETIRNEMAKYYSYNNHFEYMVEIWNAAIKKDDKVLHLGDVYFKNGLKYIKKLNGSKHLIIGNNDVKKYKNLIKLGWSAKNKMVLNIERKRAIKEEIKRKYGKLAKNIYLNGIITDIGGHRILFSHFPVFNRKKNDRYTFVRDILDDYYKLAQCSLNIHGHTHSKQTDNPFCINLSCENTMLKPIRLREILGL